MFNQDNIATAKIAQIFGSELLKVQESARTDGGGTPEIVKMDPKQFLVGQTQYTAARRAEEQRIIQALQQEAEATYPVPPPTQSYVHQTSPAAIPQHSSSPVQPNSVLNSLPITEIRNESWIGNTALDRIAFSLERIANAIDKVEIKTKRRTVKRNKAKTTKPTLLNETTS